MASTADKERRERIVTHLNRDHQRQLSHYLRHYAGLSSCAAASPTLRDVSLEHMLIRARDGSDHTVIFNPPLASWDEARARVIAMDVVARERLGGISDVEITSYVPPQGADCLSFGGLLFYFCSAASLPLITPGSALWNVLAVVFPGGPVWFRWIVRTIFVPVVLLHLFEAIMFDLRRMQRHGVQRFSGTWWLWELSCFIEGLTAWWRIDGIIARKKSQMEAKKH